MVELELLGASGSQLEPVGAIWSHLEGTVNLADRRPMPVVQIGGWSANNR